MRAVKHAYKLSTRERQFKHVLESAIDAGKSWKDAQALAARVVNKERARLARGKPVCKPSKRSHNGTYCRVKQGPELVTRGGSRRQWYPGKRRVAGRREQYACLKHGRKFKTKAGMLAHYRGRLHRSR